MRTLALLSVGVVTFGSLSATGAAADLVDSPGPGYRQQAELLGRRQTSGDTLQVPIITEVRAAPGNVDFSSFGISFSKAIRLFDEPVLPAINESGTITNAGSGPLDIINRKEPKKR